MKLNSKKLQKVAEKFTSMMIQRITEVTEDWQIPWLPVKHKDYQPRNITGRFYSGGNTFMLLIYSLHLDFTTPVFLTFLQANNMGIRIKKGASSFSVYHIAHMYYNPNNKDMISMDKYNNLADESLKSCYQLILTPKCYDVFNLDQTNFNEKYPEEWNVLQAKHRIVPDLSQKAMYANAMLDQLITNQMWVCPIEEQFSNKAYYTPLQDRIVLPYKIQFDTGESYYSTFLHEMIHSTGHQDRLNRLDKKDFNSYAKEELIAELSAAMMGFYMGIETTIRADHASYLKSWLEALHKDSSFLMGVLNDMVKAIDFMCRNLNYNPFEQYMDTDKEEGLKDRSLKEEVLIDELVIID